SKCFLPSDSGSCARAMTRYYFDVQVYDCRSFTYFGCGGNHNRFDTYEDCRRWCKPYTSTESSDTMSTTAVPG
ncbi:kappaPI-actitoxin-Avd3b, partial [Biomphalaria glabrata]